jgi:hypothetical protein
LSLGTRVLIMWIIRADAFRHLRRLQHPRRWVADAACSGPVLEGLVRTPR